MTMTRVDGYASRISVKAGEQIDFMLSAQGTDKAALSVVRLIHGDEHPDGPGFVEEHVASPLDGHFDVTKQFTQPGNFLRAVDGGEGLDHARGFTLHAFIHPTLLQSEQVILSRGQPGNAGSYALGISAEGRLRLSLHDAVIELDKPLLERIWYFVAATYDPATGAATLAQKAVINRYNSLLSRIVPFDYDAAATAQFPAGLAIENRADILIGGCAAKTHADRVDRLYSGKIDRPGIAVQALGQAELGKLMAGEAPGAAAMGCFWDTSLGYTDRGIGDVVVDTGTLAMHAHGYNRPVRGQTGWNWQGHADSFRLAPEQYGGIEFHADALTDCRWKPTVSLSVPAEWRSGAYALKIKDGIGSDDNYIVFFVRAAVPRAPLCFLVPTASYLAYGNGRSHMEGDASQVVLARVPVLQSEDLVHVGNGLEFGLSTYDHFADGAGVCYTSWRRPLFTMHPKYRVPGVDCAWQFPADLSIIGWLENEGYDYEVITDEDLHREGVAALAPYRAVINGTHAEYYSEKMLDATEDYLAQGGRITYLSGNGYYWVVGFRDDEEGIMEVRKLDAGSRAWQARPGEAYLATTGERGGLWRLRGRPPQKLVGTGFASEGMDTSVAYVRAEDSHDPEVAWIFDGVDDELIGDFGLAHGGAVGLEIDRYERTLGSPPHARLLASSQMLSQNWQLVTEDVMFMHPGLGGDQHAEVRCDMVYFTTSNRGAVFSPSSIAWGSALPVNNYRNNVSRIMKNVIDRFLSET